METGELLVREICNVGGGHDEHRMRVLVLGLGTREEAYLPHSYRFGIDVGEERWYFFLGEESGLFVARSGNGGGGVSSRV